MDKEYTYKNATVYVSGVANIHNIYKATEKFLKNVIKEKNQNGNNNPSGAIYKK